MTDDASRPASPPAAHSHAAVHVVKGTATDEELHALHRVLATRSQADRLRVWRTGRRAALRRRPEATGDR